MIIIEVYIRLYGFVFSGTIASPNLISRYYFSDSGDAECLYI